MYISCALDVDTFSFYIQLIFDMNQKDKKMQEPQRKIKSFNKIV